MIASFPIPYQDEILYSVVARYHLYSGNPLFRQTMSELFGLRKKAISVVIPQNLRVLTERVQGLSLEQLLLSHTMYPYYTAFATEKNERAVLAWAEESQPKSIDSFLNQFGARICTVEHLRFCPECYAEELQRCGEGYWHRLHQTPGVLVCQRHHRPLMETTVPYLIRNRRMIAAATPMNLFPAMYHPPELSSLGMQQAIQIAQDIEFLYNNYIRIRAAFARHQYSFRLLYLHLLHKRGLATKNGMLRTGKYKSEFLRLFAPDLLTVMKLGFDEKTARPWLVAICRGKQSSYHPLRHILMARFLCDGLENLVKLAETMAPQELARSKVEIASVADEEIKREAYRKRWLAACEANPNAWQNEIRKADGAAYTWLNRHDKEWLRHHPEKRKPRGGNKTYADWSERDFRWSQEIAPSAKRLLERPGKPAQITATALLVEAGHGRLPTEIRHRLPLTMREISKYTEDKKTFFLRKMAWAEQELVRRGEPVVRWRILKTASIRYENQDALWEAYTSRQTNGHEIA